MCGEFLIDLAERPIDLKIKNALEDIDIDEQLLIEEARLKKEGFDECFIEDYKKGFKKGFKIGRYNITLKLIKRNLNKYDDETIADVLDVDVLAVRKVRAETEGD